MLRKILAAIVIVASAACASAQERTLVIAATTSVQDSGFFDYLAPRYKERTGITLQVVSRPTAEALAVARNGFIGVVIGNNPAALDRFMDAGDGTHRAKIMFDDFIIAGPAADPAGVRGLKDAAKALWSFAFQRADFVSRGDNSGTHALEQLLWDAAGVNPKARSGNWYRESGLGMALTVGVAARLNGYVLVDRATWLAHAEGQARDILVEGDPRLFNQYELVIPNPEKYPNNDPAPGRQFADWITSDEGQDVVAAFRVAGRQVFFPNAKGHN